MKVFLSYGSAGDQVTALRLQALAAVNGLTAYVPPAYTRDSKARVLDGDTASRIGDADVVLGVIATGLSEACRQELNTGLALRKPTIVMAELGYARDLAPVLGANVIVIDPAAPEQAEHGIVQHLKAIDAEQSAKTALLALGTVALGLLIFAPQD